MFHEKERAPLSQTQSRSISFCFRSPTFAREVLYDGALEFAQGLLDGALEFAREVLESAVSIVTTATQRPNDQ